MEEQFVSWYSGLELGDDQAVRSQRWSNVRAIAKSPSAVILEVLTRLAFRAKPQPFAVETASIRSQLAEGGSPLQDEDSAVLAAAVLALIIEERDAASAKAAALVLGASCAGLRVLRQPMDLVGMAQNAQAYFAETTRRRPTLEQQKMVNTQIDITANLNALDVGDTDTLRAAMQALVAASTKSLTAMVIRQRQFETAVQGYVKVQDEELDILWWLQGAQCTQFGMAFSDVQAELRPFVFAVELAALTKVLPGPTALPSLLNRAGVDNSTQLAIAHAVQSLPKDFLGRLLPEDKAARVSAITTPILEAVRRRQEADGQDTWIAVWGTVTGIDTTATLTGLKFCESLYRELLQVALG